MVVRSSAVVQNNAGTQQVPQNQKKLAMAGPKEKLPKFNGNGTADPIKHCKTCETIWTANGITNEDDWVQQFPVTLRGVAIDWFADVDPQLLTIWANIRKEFITEFRLLRDDNEIVAEIYSTKQGKNETIHAHAYARRLKELVGKMKSPPTNGLKKRWFVEGLQSALKKKMKIIPPALYADAYNQAMDLENEQKTSKKKHKSSDSDDSSSENSSSNEESSKKVRALQKDMLQMMKEFKHLKKNVDSMKGELWCRDYKEEGHTKGSCPKKQFCDICQIPGHSIKECSFNMKSKGYQQVLLMLEVSTGTNTNNDATSGGYRNNNRRGRGGNNNNNGGRSRIQYDSSGRPMIQCHMCNL